MNEKRAVVSVVIPTLNSGKTIRKCLDSIMRLDYPKDKLEILIVDNGSDDNTLDIATKYPVKIIEEPTKGRGATYNRGFREARGDYVAYLDSDAIAPSTWLKDALQIICQNSLIATVHFKSLAPPDSSYFQKCVDTLDSKSWGGANGAVYRKSTLKKVNGFNKSLPYLQEDELKVKLIRQGYRVQVVHKPVIGHYPRENVASYFIQCIEGGIGAVKLFSATRQLNVIIKALLRAVVAVFPLLAIVLLLLSHPIAWILASGTVMCALLYAMRLWFLTDSEYRRVRYILPATVLMWISTLGKLFGYLRGCMPG